MRIGVPKETAEGERRVALIPDVVKSLRKTTDPMARGGRRRRVGRRRGGRPPRRGVLGGRRRGRVGAAPPGAPTSSFRSRCPARRRSDGCGKGQVLIGHLAPLTSPETTRALAEAGVTSFAMESIPRITRAQAMDALSSQANVAGYAATLLAAREAGRFFPMMTTAAGTVAPAKVLVLGRGRRRPAGDRDREAAGRDRHRLRHPPCRLGADREPRRPAAGARLHPRRRGEGGYARPLTDEENEKVREALAENAAKQDVIITTAQIPGRPAPLLITEDAVRGMQPGSVIVDMAGRLGRERRAVEARQDRRRRRGQGDRALEPAQRRWRPTPPSSTPRTSRTCSS